MQFFGLDDDERVIAETAAAFAEKRLAPNALEWDISHHFPVDEMREAAELGMAAIYCSEDAGGSGLRRIDAVRIFEQLAAADPTVAAFLSIHNMCAWMVDTYGTHEQRKSWVPRLASMDSIASYCLTEPGAGSDAGALRTKAVRCSDSTGDNYVLDGVKQFISGAGASDVYIVMARTGGDGPRGISAFIVENGTPGLSGAGPESRGGAASLCPEPPAAGASRRPASEGRPASSVPVPASILPVSLSLGSGSRFPRSPVVQTGSMGEYPRSSHTPSRSRSSPGRGIRLTPSASSWNPQI